MSAVSNHRIDKYCDTYMMLFRAKSELDKLSFPSLFSTTPIAKSFSNLHHPYSGTTIQPSLSARMLPSLLRPSTMLEEHDYIGLSETMDASPHMLLSSVVEDNDDDDRLKETELRLGIPGSDCHGRRDKDSGGAGLTLGFSKSFGLGAKRGFAAAIDGAGKWDFSAGCGNEVESEKSAALFSPRGDNGSRMGAAVGGKGPKDCIVGGKAPTDEKKGGGAPAAKAQVVGWPPIRNYRKNTMAANPSKSDDNPEDKQCSSCLYVKVSMDGAPFLRKVDLRIYCNYKELSKALEKMFSCYITGHCGSHKLISKDTECHTSDPHVLTYKDKDGDWMLVGDVPWEMFTDTCKRLRIMKGSEAIGLECAAPQAEETLKSMQ